MENRSLVPVLRVRDSFHARVVVARLGSEGITALLRGADGPYPIGVVEVLVLPEELEEARALLLADDVESAFPADDEEPGNEPRRRPPAWTMVAVGVLLFLYVFADVVSAR